MTIRQIRANLPEEPPENSVVLTSTGLAYQRRRNGMFGPLGASTGGWSAAHESGNQLSWVMLLSTGPLLLLTGAEELEWIKRQQREREPSEAR